MVSQVTVAGHLQGAHQTLQRADTRPGVVVEPQVAQVGHGDEGLLAQSGQLVVLQQQRRELRQALEGAVLDQEDLVLLQVQAG